MLSYLSIENFRGFRSFRSDIGPVTAILGPNSSGKTTALHAIRFACDALQIAIESDQPARLSDDEAPLVVVADGLLIDHTRLLPLSDWRALFTDQKVGEGVALQVDLRFEGEAIEELHASLVCARNEQLKLHVKVRVAGTAEESTAFSRTPKPGKDGLADFLRDHAPVAVFVPPFYGTVRQEEHRTRAIVDRMLGTGDQSHVVRNLVVRLEPKQLTRLNSFLKETIGAEIVSRTSEDEVQNVAHLSVTFRDNNGEIELSAAGAGLVNLIALYTALSRWRLESDKRPVLFLLDEPEAHLHPRLQADMSERLARLVTDEFRAQLVLATHSVDILNRLGDVGASLIRCDRSKDPSAVTLESDEMLFDDLATWADLTPYTAINFLASRRVLFCEGDDELQLLPVLAKLKFRNDPKRAQAFARWALVRLHGASNAPVARLLSRLVQSEAVRVQARAETFHIALVLDRDHERRPGTNEREQDGVKEQITVWSQHSIESLLLSEQVLTTWVKAFLGDKAPHDLQRVIAEAIDAADQDALLNDYANEQLIAKLIKSELPGDGAPLHGDKKAIHAVREAKRRVSAEPQVWQRGKDRGGFILRQIREALPAQVKSQFPTDVIRLATRADSDRIGDPAKAIPVEVSELLDRLTRP